MKTLNLLLMAVITISFLSCEKDVVPGNEFDKLQSTKISSTYSLICGGDKTELPCCKMWLHDEGDWSLQFFSNGSLLEKYYGNTAVATWKLDDLYKEIKIEYLRSPANWNNKVLSIVQISEENLLLKEKSTGNHHPFTKCWVKPGKELNH